MFENVAREAHNTMDFIEHEEVWWDILVEPAIEEHVADSGAHGNKMETKESKMVESEKRISKIETKTTPIL